MARGLGLFGELGCTGDSMRYHSLQQRHQRMRKEWAVADRLGIDAAHTAASQGFPRKRQSSPSPTTERPKYRKPGRKGRYEGQRIKVRFTTWPDLRVDCLTRKNLKDRSLEADVTLGQDAEMEGTWRHPKSKMEPET